MARKYKAVSIDTKLLAIHEVDKKGKNMLSETRNTFAPCLPFMAKHQAVHAIKHGYFP